MAAENEKLSVNQIFKNYALPLYPGVKMGDWLEHNRTMYSQYQLRGGKKDFESWLKMKYEKITKDIQDAEGKSNATGDNAMPEQEEGKKIEQEKSWFQRNKGPIASTAIMLGLAGFLGYLMITSKDK